jgi:signal peptidase
MTQGESTSGPASARWLRIVVAAVVVVAAVPVVVFAVPQVVGADRSLAVVSGSMRPTVAPGDAVVVERVAPESIETGDVVTYRTRRGTDGEQQFVTHRVVRVLDRPDGLAFRTKGDANESPDPQPVPAADVVGRVVLVLPLVGHVVVFARSDVGMILLVGGPVALLLLSELRTRRRKSRTAPDSNRERATGGTTPRADVGRSSRHIGSVGPPAGTTRRRGIDDGTRRRSAVRTRVLDAGDDLTILRVVDADPEAEAELRDGRRLSVRRRGGAESERR